MKLDKDAQAESNRHELEKQIQELQRNVRDLKLEHDLLKKANELLKKDLGVDLQILGNREKTMLIDVLRKEYDLTELLKKLDMPRS